MASENYVDFCNALGNYERSVAERKFRIAEAEDKISNLKAVLEEARKHNEQWESKCETLRLESEMGEACYQTATHKKSLLESKKAPMVKEYEEVCKAVENKKSMLENIEKFRDSRVANIKKTEIEFMEGYKKIPAIGAYLESSEELKQLETSFQEKQLEIEEKRKAVEQLDQQAQENWKSFVKLCIEIAESQEAIRQKTKEYEDLYRKQNITAVTKQPNMESMNSTGIDLQKQMDAFSKAIVDLEPPKRQPFKNNNNHADFKILTIPGPINFNNRAQIGLGSLRSQISLEERLQQIKNRSRDVTQNDPNLSTGSTSGELGTLGIKRYFNALEEMKSKSFSKPNNVTNTSLDKSMDEIRKRYSKQGVPSTEKSEGQQVPGYSSWLTEMVESQRRDDTQLKPKKSKSDVVLQENCEVIMDTDEVNNKCLSKGKTGVKALSLDSSDKQNNPSPITSAITTSDNIKDKGTSNKEISTPKEKPISMRNDTSGLFKVPPPPPAHKVSVKSKCTTLSSGTSAPFECSDIFMGDGHQFSMDTTTLDIFGNESSAVDTNNDDMSEGNAAFDFENLFGSAGTTDSDSALNDSLF